MAVDPRLRSFWFTKTRTTGDTDMNRTTSRHLASSISADRWAAADRTRLLRGQDDDETGNDHGRFTALTAWASRVQRTLGSLPHRTAADSALD